MINLETLSNDKKAIKPSKLCFDRMKRITLKKLHSLQRCWKLLKSKVFKFLKFLFYDDLAIELIFVLHKKPNNLNVLFKAIFNDILTINQKAYSNDVSTKQAFQHDNKDQDNVNPLANNKRNKMWSASLQSSQ